MCTGFSEHIFEEAARQLGIGEFIMKPFEMRGLAETFRKVMDEEQ
jgi:hypothetical protein